MKTFSHIKISEDQTYFKTKIIELNRPEIRNAFNAEMIQELTEAFLFLDQDQATDVILLHGSGQVFCAGADLNWMKSMVNYSLEENKKDSEKLWTMFESIAFCSKPVIGVIHGAAFGGALGLMACCDYVIADENLKCCFSEVKLGLSPAVISSFVLRKTQDGYVRPLMLSAEIFDAQKALQLGLVHKIIKAKSESIINDIAYIKDVGPEALKATKHLLNKTEFFKTGLHWSQLKNLTTQIISERRVSDEGQLRLKKFLSKG